MVWSSTEQARPARRLPAFYDARWKYALDASGVILGAEMEIRRGPSANCRETLFVVAGNSCPQDLAVPDLTWSQSAALAARADEIWRALPWLAGRFLAANSALPEELEVHISLEQRFLLAAPGGALSALPNRVLRLSCRGGAQYLSLVYLSASGELASALGRRSLESPGFVWREVLENPEVAAQMRSLLAP